MVRRDGKLWGELALHYLERQHVMSEDDRETLRTASDVLTLVLERRSAAVRLRAIALFRSRIVEYLFAHPDYADVEKFICEHMVAISEAQHLVLFRHDGSHEDFFGADATEHCRECARRSGALKMNFGVFGDAPEVIMPDGARAAGLNRPEGCPCTMSVLRQFRRADGTLWRVIADYTVRPPEDLKAVSRSLEMWLDLLALAYDRERHTRLIERQIREAEELNARLIAERERSAQAEKAKAAFFSSVSHDIRTPLNAIIGFSELLQDDGVPRAERKESLRMIETSSKTLLHLINDLLDLSKLEADRMRIELEPTDCAGLLDEIVPVFRQMAEQKGQRLVCDKPETPVLMLDPYRLRQILFNLIGNAVKYAGPCTIRVSASCAYGKLSLVVEDDGKGIAPEDAQRLMQPYAQVGAADRTTGTGLGLAICRQIAERMGGTLLLDSALGKGCRFTVRIPAAEAPAGKPADAAPAAEGRAPGPVPHAVLVVDDSGVNRAVIKAMLRKLGVAEVFTVGNGREALAVLAKRQDFDLVMADMWMPEMNGGELVARRLVALHAKAAGGEMPFPISLESEGTRQMLDFIPALARLTEPNQSMTFVVDEIDNKLHHLVTRALVEDFIATCTADTRTQLIFTTHDLLLMDQDLCRRDEMWVTDKAPDGSATLADFASFEGLRKGTKIRDIYLDGRLGGIPRHIGELGAVIKEVAYANA